MYCARIENNDTIPPYDPLPERHQSPREGTMESSMTGLLGLQIKVHCQCDQSPQRSKLETLGRPRTEPNTEIHISSNPSRCLAQLWGRVPECEVEQTTNKQNAPAQIRHFSARKAVDARMWVTCYINIIDCCVFTDSVWKTPGLSCLSLPDSASSSASTVYHPRVCWNAFYSTRSPLPHQESFF